MWRSVKDDPPPKDGTNILFGRSLPWSASGNVCVGYWHAYQNTPGWEAINGGGRIAENVWIYWMPIPAPPTL